MTYVTADLDWPTRMRITKTWHRIANADPDGDLSGRVSASGHGVHIRSRDVLPADVPVAERERRVCCDDPKRIRGDVQDTLCHNQVFFDRKGDAEAGRWVERLDTLLSEYKRSVNLLPEHAGVLR